MPLRPRKGRPPLEEQQERAVEQQQGEKRPLSLHLQQEEDCPSPLQEQQQENGPSPLRMPLGQRSGHVPLQRPLSVVSVLCERVNESFLVLAACVSSAATPAAPRISSNAAPACGAATSWATTSTAGMPYHAPDDGLSPRGRFGKGSHAEMAVKADDPCGARRSSKPRSIVGSLSSRNPCSTSSTGSREAGSVEAGVRGREAATRVGAATVT